MRSTEPAAYPSDLEDHIVLPNRRFLRIRPLRRCEEDMILELYDHLSPRTLYLRFLSQMPRLPDYMVRMLGCVDYRRQLALVAEHDNGTAERSWGWRVLERSTMATWKWRSSFETTGNGSTSAPNSPAGYCRLLKPADSIGSSQTFAQKTSRYEGY